MEQNQDFYVHLQKEPSFAKFDNPNNYHRQHRFGAGRLSFSAANEFGKTVMEMPEGEGNAAGNNLNKKGRFSGVDIW